MPQHADVIFAGGAIYTPDGSGRRLVPATAAGGLACQRGGGGRGSDRGGRRRG